MVNRMENFTAFFLIFIAFLVTGCSPSNTLPEQNNITLQPIATNTAHPPLVEATAIVEVNWENCPTKIEQHTNTGVVLINSGKIFDEHKFSEITKQPYIEAIGLNGGSPQIINISANTISPDGLFSVFALRNAEDLTQELIVYNFVNKEEKRIFIPYEFSFMRWLTNEKIRLEAITEKIEGVGQTHKTLLVNIISGQVETDTLTLELPNFAFNDSDSERFGLFYGYADLDPFGELILYSAKNDNQNYEIRLFDIKSQKIIWQQETASLSSFTPQWSLDGSKVYFNIRKPPPLGETIWDEIISLNRNGQMEELPQQPFPFVVEEGLAYYSPSPDGKYIFYLTLNTNLTDFSVKYRAFLVDTQTGKVGEVCTNEEKFIASIPAQENEVLWLPNNKLAYRLLVEKDGKKTHSLHLLNPSDWTTSLLFESEAGNGIELLGWSSINP